MSDTEKSDEALADAARGLAEYDARIRNEAEEDVWRFVADELERILGSNPRALLAGARREGRREGLLEAADHFARLCGPPGDGSGPDPTIELERVVAELRGLANQEGPTDG